MFLFSPSGPATTIHNSSQYLALMQLISKIISHKPGHLSFPETIFPYKITLMEDVSIFPPENLVALRLNLVGFRQLADYPTPVFNFNTCKCILEQGYINIVA